MSFHRCGETRLQGRIVPPASSRLHQWRLFTRTKPEGLIQGTPYGIFHQPSLRPLVVLPTNSSVNYRASCFVTGKSIDAVCLLVCLCIMSIVPDVGKCPTCQSIRPNILSQLRRSRRFSPGKRKLARPMEPQRPAYSRIYHSKLEVGDNHVYRSYVAVASTINTQFFAPEPYSRHRYTF